jgi:hypothetical protein
VAPDAITAAISTPMIGFDNDNFMRFEWGL